MNVGIYTRISQDSSGVGEGVARQETDCRALAAKNGWTVTDVYTDNDVSATRSRFRPQYERMLSDVRAGRIQGIVVLATDRLTRTPRELEDVLDLAHEHGLQLASVRDGADLATAAGRTLTRIMGTLARQEIDTMSARLRSKLAAKAAAGEPLGPAPYGFERRRPPNQPRGTPGALKLDFIVPEQAAVIREATKRALGREPLRSISADLNRRGVPSPGSTKWDTTSLRQVLIRPVNAGLRIHRGAVVGDALSEPIISKDLHYQLVALFTDPTRRVHHEGPGFKYLLAGIAVCGLCDGKVRRQEGGTYKSRAGGMKQQAPSYGCASCFKVRRNQERVDEVVVAAVLTRFKEPDIIKLFGGTDLAEVIALQDELDGLNARLEVALDMFGAGDFDRDDYSRAATGIKARRVEVERSLALASPASPLAELASAPDVWEKWLELHLDAQRLAVDVLVAVKILPLGRGGRFTKESVEVVWKV